MSDKEQYLEDLRAEVKAAQSRNELGLAQFKRAPGMQHSEQALQQVGVVSGAEPVQLAMEILGDKNQDSALREQVLRKSISAIGANAEYVGICLDILADKDEPAALRKAVLTALKALSFSSRTFVSLRSQYMATLRSLLDETDTSLREMVAEELAQHKDAFVQQRLLDGLTNREPPIVSQAKAIQLLSYDIHAGHYPIVRQILRNPASDEVTKVEAIHSLANDLESKELLIDLMLDKDQVKEIRMTSAVALQTIHPSDFIQLAKPLVLDETEYNDIRLVALNSLMQHQDKNALAADLEFSRKMSELSTVAKSPEVRQLSRRFLQSAGKQHAQ
jgi:hypothetical protein